MSSNKPLKVVVCGPAKGGKTSIANFVAGHTEQLGNTNKIYEATVGARYLKLYSFTICAIETWR